MQRHVVIPGVCWCQFHSPTRKHSKIVQTGFRSEKRVSSQDLRSVEGERTVPERFFELKRRHKRNASKPRLVFGIPVFERRFQVGFEKIDGGKEFARVRILRVKTKRRAQAVFRGSKISLLVCNAGQLDKESRISRRFPQAGLKRHLCFAPFFLAGKCEAQQKIKIRRLIRGTTRQIRCLFPVPGIESPSPGGQAGLFRGMILSEARRSQNQHNSQKKDHAAFSGTARSIQLRFGRHSFSNSARSIRRSLPRAGSLMKTASLCQSIPATTT